MEITREDLIERFRTFSDEELQQRASSGTLTSLALEVALSELRSRGIEPSATPEETSAAEDSDVDLTTVAEFWDPIRATLMRSILEAHGIFAFVWGEHLGIANPILASATGGLRIQVRSDQQNEAREIIAAFERGEFALDEGAEAEE